VALVVNPQPEIGIGEPVGIWLDLDRGACREAKVVSQGEADQAAFVISGDYQHWKRVIRKELGPIAGSCSASSCSRGRCRLWCRFVKSAEQLVEAAATVPTRFLMNKRPAQRFRSIFSGVDTFGKNTRSLSRLNATRRVGNRSAAAR